MDTGELRETALQTLSKNLNDSVVAPLFWVALLGLPGAYQLNAGAPAPGAAAWTAVQRCTAAVAWCAAALTGAAWAVRALW